MTFSKVCRIIPAIVERDSIMALQDTASTAGILAELNNRLTSYESTIRELKSKNRDFVNRLRDSQQIRKDLCIKVNNLQNDLEKKEKELKIHRDQNKQLKKRVTNLNELNSNYQSKIEELKTLCEQFRNSARNNEVKCNEEISFVNTENTNNSLTNIVHEKRQHKAGINDNNSSKDQDESINQPKIRKDLSEHNESINSSGAAQPNQNKSLIVKKGDLKFSVEEINDSNMKYIPVSDDPIDRAIATFTNARKNKIRFTRVKQGTYVYGRLMVEAKLVTKPGVDKNKPLLRIVSRGKLYTLADFVNTHENEELNNIEDSIRNNNGNLVPEGQALVVTSPINKFRPTQIVTPSSPLPITSPPLVQNATNACSGKGNSGNFQYIQSPLSFSSNRIPVIDPKHPQGIKLPNYLVNYPNGTHELLASQNTNPIITSSYYSNNGIQQLSPINNSSSSSLMQLPSIIPQQYPYYHNAYDGLNINNQYNHNIGYQGQSKASLITPPPIAEYMPVTTPIIMARQPINTLNTTNNVTTIPQIPITQSQPQGTISNDIGDSKIISHNRNSETVARLEEKDHSELNKSIQINSTSPIPQNSNIMDKNLPTAIPNSQSYNSKLNISSSKKETNNSLIENDATLNIKECFQSQKTANNVSSIKSVSASTIGEWYRQANIMKRCNSYSCENFSISNRN
ncbi:coiled coil protein [Cryptosporidium felis]|nr:coiled coil protein [Cryptosporidium felis]